MKVNLHWAVFGEQKKGSHGWLRDSLQGADPRILESLAAKTDRPTGSIPGNGAIQSFLTGFPDGAFYVLTRTMPDPTAKRGGMVASFCLLLPIDAINAIENLGSILALLPALESSASTMREWGSHLPTEWHLHDESVLQVVTESSRSHRLALSAGLLREVLPAVWAGAQSDFEDALVGVWAHLPDMARSTLHFGHSYDPNDIGDPIPRIVSTLPMAAPRWRTKLIPEVTANQASTRAEALLLGESNASLLQDLLTELPAVTNLDAIRSADRLLAALERFEAGEVGSAVAAARLLVKLAPLPNQAQTRKQSLVSALERDLAGGSREVIQRFGNLEMDAFGNEGARFRDALGCWADARLETDSSIDARFVSSLFDNTYAMWWREALLERIQHFSQQLTRVFVERVWSWLEEQPMLLEEIGVWLTDSADERLFASAPGSPRAKTAAAFLRFIERNQQLRPVRFPRLETYARFHCGELPRDTFKRCLEQPNECRLRLEILAQVMGFEAFVQTALAFTATDVILVAGALCANHPDLLHGFEARHPVWQRIWLASIQLEPTSLGAVPDPSGAVFQILDQQITQGNVEPALLATLATSMYANLINFPNRTAVWNALPQNTQIGFLDATTQGVFALWAANSRMILEVPLESAVFAPDRISTAVLRIPTSASNIIERAINNIDFNRSPPAYAVEIVSALVKSGASISETLVREFATHIREKKWSTLALEIFQGFRNTRTDTLSLLSENTVELLSGLERLVAIVELKLPTRYIDYYRELRVILCDLYPHGPQSEGLWHDIGGKPGDLVTSVSVNYQWESALTAIRRDSRLLHKLLEVARQRFSHDNRLEEFQRLAKLI